MKNLALHILDISENSLRARARNILIKIDESLLYNKYDILIEDDGEGIPVELFETITDPFTTTRRTRKIGLGLPLFKQKAEMCEGSFHIKSEPGKGCKVVACFKNDHIDKPPSGDIPGVIRILASSNPGLHIKYLHITDFGRYEFDSEQVKSEIGETEFFNPLIQKYMKEMISQNLINIKAS